MTILLKKLIIFDENGQNPLEITDDERINVKISQGTKGSTVDIILKNAWEEHVVAGEFRFGVDNIVKLWLKWAIDGDDSIDTDSSDDLIMSADIIDIESSGEENSTIWKLSCMDRTFLMLNRLWAKNYPQSESKTAPELIKEIINVTTGTGKGILGTDLKADFAEGGWNTTTGIFTRTGGGYIQNSRPDNSDFPSVAITKVFKPVYEWINDLSQPDLTNTSTELSETGSPPAPRPYYFFIDEDNNFHWEYPDNKTPSYHFTWGSTSAVSPDTNIHYIKSFRLKKAVFDIINLVIFNSGDDFYGSGILDYFYDPTTRSPKLQPVYRPWIDIASSVIYREIFEENPGSYTENNGDADNPPGTLVFQGKRYDASYPLTPHWSSTSVANDTELNNSLRNHCAFSDTSIGRTRARRLTQRKSNPRWKGKIVIRGGKLTIGELIQFNSSDHGIINAKVRITDVQHNISKDGWDTTISVEEDALEITN